MRVDETELLWIPMPDGVRLAARLWLPEGAHAAPVPALFEYIPYRKADMVRARDERNHPYFAAHGYACLRVDMRGSGDSDGHMPDMYADNERDDAKRVIEWIAAQPWCSGAVGMFGTSWGGTASLQASCDAPAALKAVIAVCATHDRYEDDIHHKGGCLLTDSLEWGASLPAILAAPPTAESGADWRTRWKERVERLDFPLEAWLREEARGSYWRSGSVIDRPERLSRPILALGGWSDRYSNSVMSLLDARPDLVWGVIGPWGHHYPDQGEPGPAVGFQRLALQWFDAWLGADAPTPPDWPRLRAWLRAFDPPGDLLATRNGHWIASGPPAAETEPETLKLGEAAFSTAAAAPWRPPADLRVGEGAGDTGYFGRKGGQPLDQGADDARSLSFETAPMAADRLIYGACLLRMVVDAPAQVRQLVFRLIDVAPDGAAARITFAARNLALDDALDAPAQPFPDGPRAILVRFPTAAYRLRRGHRLRLALSSSYWPLIWPAPAAGDVAIEEGALVLPLFRGEPALGPTPPEVEETGLTPRYDDLDAPPLARHARIEANASRVEGWRQPMGRRRFHDTGVAFGAETTADHRLALDDPLAARSAFAHALRFERPDGVADIRCVVETRCDAEAYAVDARLEARFDGATVAERHWRFRTLRRFS